MTDADAKRLASIRAVYAAAQPPYTTVDFLLRMLDETNTERDAIAAANAEKADDLAEWNEIAVMVQEAIGPDGRKPASSLPPMNFDTAIRKIKRQRDEAIGTAARLRSDFGQLMSDFNIGAGLVETARKERDAFRVKLVEQCGKTLQALTVVNAARPLASVLSKGHPVRMAVEAWDAANVTTGDAT